MGDFCSNCGALGTVKLPRWAIESIRKSASWVGKRYYPTQEDDDTELHYLRSIVRHPLNRRIVDHPITISESEAYPGTWTASREGLSITYGAKDRKEAEEKARPFMPVIVAPRRN